MSGYDGLRAYDDAADIYRVLHHRCPGLAASIVRYGGVRPGHRILDVGCGPGDITRRLAGLAGEAGSAIGLDISPRMIELAEAGNTGSPRAEFRVGDMNRLPADLTGFDLVVAAWSIFFADDVAGTVDVLRQRLNPGGTLLLTTLARNALHPFSAMFLDLTQLLCPELPIRTPWSPLTDIGNLVDLVRATGLRGRVDVRHEDIVFPLERPEESWDVLIRGSGLNGIAVDLPADVRERVRHSMIEWTRANGVTAAVAGVNYVVARDPAPEDRPSTATGPGDAVVRRVRLPDPDHLLPQRIPPSISS
jgi:SAM-dependent methyltransferase